MSTLVNKATIAFFALLIIGCDGQHSALTNSSQKQSNDEKRKDGNAPDTGDKDGEISAPPSW